MKTVATIFFILFIGTTTQAHEKVEETKVTPIEMTIVSETAFEINLEKTTKVARLYKNKNYRVIKALSFTTKRNKAKMA